MHTKTLSSNHACAPGAIAGGLTRTRFFDGMFLTQADLENEQVYWRMKRRLTNRALGTGVVWGLRLTFDHKTRRYKLSPGYALDCCGNDLIVECPVEVTERELWDRADRAVTMPSLDTASRVRRACVVLQYVECPEEVRPVHRDPCGDTGGHCEPSRIRETARLLLVPECADDPCDVIAGFLRTIERLKAETPNAGWTTSSPPSEEELRSGVLRRIADHLGRDPKHGFETIGALLLAAVHAYLTDASAHGGSPAGSVTGSYLSSIIWNTFFGTDPQNLDEATRNKLVAATHHLFESWCASLLYTGPRCHDEHHGVYLGCVTLTRTGAVDTFDPWACRRSVLTGPLIDHWLCVFGLPSLDVLVARLAQASCDVADTEDVPVLYRTAHTAARNLESSPMVSGTRAVSPFDLVVSTIRAAVTPPSADLVRLEATAPNGQPIRMVVPRDPDRGGSPASELAGSVLAADRDVPPLARAPLHDLIVGIAGRTPVTSIVATPDAAAARRLGTMTVSDLLSTGPEAIATRLGGRVLDEAERTSVNRLFTAAETLIRDAAAATAPLAKAGLTRATLAGNDPLKTALRKVHGITSDIVDAAATAASKR